VKEFASALGAAITVPLQTMDERLTTVQATRLLRAANVRARDQRSRVDGTAAAVMLQAYLDARGP
jgi:putative Holliday junction resolvase